MRTDVYLVGASMDKLVKSNEVADPATAKRFAGYKSRFGRVDKEIHPALGESRRRRHAQTLEP